MRVALLLLALSTGAVLAAPSPHDGLYAATAYVTGTRAETRRDGIILCLHRVMVKLSGNPALLDDPRVATFDELVSGMVEDVAYLDRLSDEPHHDEQGTRDRPFDLTVHFAPDRIAAALTLLGEHAWTGPRPRVLARIQIDDHGAMFPLAADTASDERQREALLAAADRYGLRVVLAPAEGAAPVMPSSPVVLSGQLRWDEAHFGWTGSWHLHATGIDREWGIEGVSFDDALRDAMAGSLSSLRAKAATDPTQP